MTIEEQLNELLEQFNHKLDKIVRAVDRQQEALSVVSKYLGKQLFPLGNPVLERQQIEADPKSIDMPALKPLMRDWEVLELDKSGFKFPVSDSKVWLSITDYLTLEGAIETGMKIHSVRRTTDGQVFTVGDRIKEGVIDLFSIEGNRMDVWTEPGNEIRFQLIGHVKKSVPIYTSADGVAIFEGDTVYEYSNGVIMKTHAAVGKTYSGPLYSSREAAMKAHQPPLFTTADGVSLFDSSDLLYCYDPKNGGVYELVLGNITPDTLNYQYYSSRTAAEAAYKNWLYDQPVLKLSDIGIDNFPALVELVKSRLV